MRRERLVPLVFALIAIAFFVAPIAMRAAGSKVACCPENRPFAPAPKLADGWNVFDDTTRFLIDRMPGRQRAIRANTWIDHHIFASTPNYGKNAIGGVAADQALTFGRPSQDKTSLQKIQPADPGSGPPELIGDVAPIAYGTHGWLYLEHDFDHGCHTFTPVPRAIASWIRFIDTIRASGRNVVLVVPADKSTIYPEFVKASTPELACSRPGRARQWTAVYSPAARRAGIIGLRNRLQASKATHRSPIYYTKDSHWNEIGALTLPQAAVPALDPSIHVLPSEIVNTGPAKHTGDIAALLGGGDATELAPTRAIRRAPGAPVIPGPAVLIGDSFSDAAAPLLAPYFANLKRVEWTPPAELLASINGAHTVVLEVVEWQFNFYTSKFGPISPAFQRVLARRITPLH